MGKILECIFAYVCKSNYVGECLPADQIYTITKNSSEKDISNPKHWACGTHKNRCEKRCFFIFQKCLT